MRNAGQSAAASRSASVFMHVEELCSHGGCTVRIYEGPGGERRLFEVPFCEYTMRGSPGSHPALLVPPSTKWAYAIMVDVSTVRISEAPGVNIAYLRSLFANTQCEAVWRCIMLGSRQYAPNKHHSRR